MNKKLKESSTALLKKLEQKEKILKDEYEGEIPLNNPELRMLREQQTQLNKRIQ